MSSKISEINQKFNNNMSMATRSEGKQHLGAVPEPLLRGKSVFNAILQKENYQSFWSFCTTNSIDEYDDMIINQEEFCQEMANDIHLGNIPVGLTLEEFQDFFRLECEKLEAYMNNVIDHLNSRLEDEQRIFTALSTADLEFYSYWDCYRDFLKHNISEIEWRLQAKSELVKTMKIAQAAYSRAQLEVVEEHIKTIDFKIAQTLYAKFGDCAYNISSFLCDSVSINQDLKTSMRVVTLDMVLNKNEMQSLLCAFSIFANEPSIPQSNNEEIYLANPEGWDSTIEIYSDTSLNTPNTTYDGIFDFNLDDEFGLSFPTMINAENVFKQILEINHRKRYTLVLGQLYFEMNVRDLRVQQMVWSFFGGPSMSLELYESMIKVINKSFNWNPNRSLIRRTLIRALPCEYSNQMFGMSMPKFDLSDDTKALATDLLGTLRSFSENGLNINHSLPGFSPSTLMPSFLEGFTKVFPHSFEIGVLFLGLTLMFIRNKYPGNNTLNILSSIFSVWNLCRGNTILSDVYNSWLTPTAQGPTDSLVDLAVEAISLTLFSRTCNFNSIKSFGVSVSEVDKYSGSLHKYLGRVKEFLLKAIFCICEFFGVQINMGLSTYQNDLDNIERDIKSVIDEYQENRDKLLPSHVATTLSHIDSAILDLEMRMKADINNKGIRDVLNNYKRLLQPVRVAVDESSYVSRDEPFVIYICGHPGGGKSFSERYVTHEISTIAMDARELADFARNPGRSIWTYTMGAKTYDGYVGHPVTVINDCFVATDAAAQESEATFIINAVGANDYVLKQAELSKKGRIKFMSKMICINGNLTHIPEGMILSIRTRQALLRRLKNAWRQTVKEEFWLDEPAPAGGTDPKWYKKLDPEKVMNHKIRAGMDETYYDVYLYYRWNLETDLPIDGPYTIEQMVEMNEEMYQKRLVLNEQKRTGDVIHFDRLIEKRMRKFRPQMDNSEELLALSAESFNTAREWSALSMSDFDSDYEDNSYEKVHFKSRASAMNSEDRVQLLSDVSESDSLRIYIKGYLKECASKFKVLDFTEYPAYQDNPGHPIHALILNCSLRELNQVIDAGLTGNILIEFLRAYNLCGNFSKSLMDVSRSVLVDIKQVMIDAQTKWWLWFHDHPTLKLFLDGFKAGSVVALGMCSGFALIIKLLSYYFGERKIELIYTCPVCLQKLGLTQFTPLRHCELHQMQINGTQTYEGMSKKDLVHDYHERVISCYHKCPECLPGGLCGEVAREEENIPGVAPINVSADLIPELKDDGLLEVPHIPQTGSSETLKFINARLNNAFKLYMFRKVEHDGKWETYSNEMSAIWFLGGKVAMTNYHTYLACEMYTKMPGTTALRIGLSSFRQHGKDCQFVFNYVDLKVLHIDRDHDLVFLHIPMKEDAGYLMNYFPSNKDREFNRFIRDPENKIELQMAFKREGYVQYSKATMSYGGPGCFYPCETVLRDPITGNSISSTELGIPNPIINHAESWQLDVNTFSGDCLSAGFIVDPIRKRFANENPMYQCPIPIYFHNSTSATRIATGSIIYREYFEPILKHIVNKISAPEERIKASVKQCAAIFGDLVEGGIDIDLKPPTGDYPDFAVHHRVIGELPSMNKNTTSNIDRSPLYDLFPRTRKPIKMFNHSENGVFVKVMERARLDYGSNTNCVLPEFMAEYIGERIATALIHDSGPIKTRRNLSYEEAILGCPEMDISPIGMMTSPGTTLNLIKKRLGAKGKGKRWLFGDGENPNLNTPEAIRFKQFFDWCLDLVKKGDRCPNVYTDCTKDELRAPGKTCRLFCCGELHYLIMQKMYLGAFASWIQDNRIKNRICVGINPCSPEWDELYNKWVTLDIDELNAIFGDFRKFDKKQIQDAMYSCWQCIEQFYGHEDEEGNKIRWLLFQDIIHSFHTDPNINGSVVYEWLHGNTSGNFLTAILNSIVNIFMHVFCMCALMMVSQKIDLFTCKAIDIPFSLVWRNSYQGTYGDDTGLTVVKKALPVVNFNSIKWAMLFYFNMDYTDELKTEGNVPDFRKVRDCMFISRSFVPTSIDGAFRILSPLKLPSIIESFQWRRGNSSDAEVLDVAQTSVIEMSQHGELAFNAFIKILAPAVERKMKTSLKITSYKLAFRLLLERQAQNWYLTPEGGITKPIMGPIHFVSESSPIIIEENFLYQSMADSGKSERLADSSEVTPASGEKLVSKTISMGEVAPKQNTTSLCNQTEKTLIASTPQSSNVESRIDGGNSSNEGPKEGVICDSSATTCWTEASGKVSSHLQQPRMLSEMIQKSESIEMFLGKPYLLSAVQYTTATAAAANIYNLDIASVLSSVTQWANKIQGFAMMRGTFVLRVEANAYPFQSGGLLIHYLPNYTDIANNSNHVIATTHNGNLNVRYQHPYIELDLRETVAEIKIPYISPTSFYGIKENYGDWGRVFIDALCPLRTGASGLTFAELSIFGYWENVELAAPSVPQVNMRETKEASGPISSGLRTVGKVADVLSQVPFISEVAGAVSWAANIGASIASILGWSKPRLDSAPMAVTRQTMRYAGTADGPDVSMPSAVIYNNELALTDSYSITKEDEMSFKFLLSIPSYKETLVWTTGNASGTSLYNLDVGPKTLCQGPFTKTYTGHTTTYYQGAPIYYLSRQFSQWRGDIKVRGKMFKTQYHSGRLLLTWTPGTQVATAPTLATSILSYRQIIDIREQSEFEFNLPYQCVAPYLFSDEAPQYSGKFCINVLNDLRAPETCSGSVDILLFFFAGDNFEFQCPSYTRGGSAPYTAQSGSGETLIKSGIADTEIHGLTTLYSKNCIGEHILSVKQMLNRFTQLRAMAVGAGQVFNQSFINYFPYFASMMSMTAGGALDGPIYGGDAMSWIMPMYAYCRGGTRFWIIQDSASVHISGVCLPDLFIGSNTTYSGIDNTFNGTSIGQITVTPYGTGTRGDVPFQAPINNDLGPGIHVQHIPYYSRYPVSHVYCLDNRVSLATGDPTFPTSAGFFTVNPGASFSASTIIGRSAADDFQLSFFIGCPPVATSYV